MPAQRFLRHFPMVVYKAQHCYHGWMSDGIKGAVYDSTSSGWFDMKTFEKWFREVFLKHVEGVDGPKVLIGDNLSSHFSPAVIALCKEHNIRFLTLVPSSTHLCQPLDVAVFRPMKVLWRAILTRWKVESRSRGTVPKETFPRLLDRVFHQLKPSNLISGFRACGIVPLDSSQVIQRLPGKTAVCSETTRKVLNESVVELLKTHLGVGPSCTPRPRRGNKVSEPGKAITIPVADVNDGEVNWVCGSKECGKAWDKDGADRWIVCDMCDRAYHLHCSRVQYRKEDYNVLDVESIHFDCAIHGKE